MRAFDKKVVMITGASSGIGRTTAIKFAKQGAKVVLVARRGEEGIAVEKEIQDFGGEAHFIKADVSIESEVENAVSLTLEKYDRLDIAFNNAGVAELPVGTTELTETEWDRVLNINLKGTWLCMKYQIPQMLNNGGAIVNMASVYGLVGTSMGLPAYVASKHGVVGLTKAAALEYAPRNIRVNAICPGWIPTPGNEMALNEPEIKAFAESLHPMARLGAQDDVANAVIWLSSEGAAFITGQSLAADGGYTAQ